MAENALAAETRTETGKGVARKLRAAGRIPAVLYGKSIDAVALSVDPKALDTVLHASGAGLNTLIELEVGGASEKVLLKALQREPVGGAYVHADFHQVDLAVRVTVSIPLHFIGTPRGVALDGGILDHPVRDVDVECLPTAIPENIEVDVSEIDLGGSIHVSDISLPEGAELRSDGELTVASVVAPKEVEEEVIEPVEGEEVETEEGAEAPAEGESKEPSDD